MAVAKSFRIDPLSLPPFAGFGPGAFAFFTALAAHQDREWFAAHREVYEAEAHRPMVALMAEVIDGVGRLGLQLGGDPVKSVFRIHRDVRFSRDKTPYKTNVSAALSQGGGRTSGVLYVQIGADECFAAAGFYGPPRETLEAIRATIAHHPQRYRACVAALAKSGLAFDEGDALARLPRGYEGDYPDDIAVALRRKSATVRLPLAPALVASRDLVGAIVGFAAAAAPINALA